jgi:quinol monooxygenase YgiN
VKAHEAFRASEGFAEWRALVGPFYAAPPEVEHTETVVSTF